MIDLSLLLVSLYLLHCLISGRLRIFISRQSLTGRDQETLIIERAEEPARYWAIWGAAFLFDLVVILLRVFGIFDASGIAHLN